MKSFWVFLALGLVLCSGLAQATDLGEAVGSYSMQLSDGHRWSSDQARGRVVLIHFWASWCEPCRREMPAMERFYRAHHGDGFDLLAVDMDDDGDLPKAQQIMKSFSFPWGRFDDAAMQPFGRIWRLPLTFVVDRQGVLRQNAWDGPKTDSQAGELDEKALNEAILPLLGLSRAASPVAANNGAEPVSAPLPVPITIPIRIEAAHARATAPGQTVGVVYLVIENQGDKPIRWTGASSPVARSAMFHRTMEMEGMSHMMHQDSILVPPHGRVTLEPGGLHLMLEGLRQPLKAGQSIELALQFDGGAETTILVPITPLGQP